MKARGILALGTLFAASVASACTGMYAGRAASADGTVLYGRTVDASPWLNAHMIRVTPRVENVPGRVYASTLTAATWPLPATTWKFISTPRITSLNRGVMDSCCINERGLAISGTVSTSTNAKTLAVDPFLSDGFGEDSLPGLLIQCCASAREAVELTGRVIAAKGHTHPEIYVYIDKTEAWYVEVYTGHQWAAVRMPEDAVAVFGNQFMLRDFNPAAEGSLASPGLLSVPAKAGTLVAGSAGCPIDLFRTYAEPLSDYSNYRTWYGHHVFAPETAGAYAPDRAMPLFYKPSRKIGLRDMFELIRTRYEGTSRCPEWSGDQTVRVIGTTKQSTCHVISLDPALPEATRATMWVTMANAEHSPFVPVNAAVTRSARGYEWDQRDASFRYEPNLPGLVFRRLATLAELKRYWYGENVRKYWFSTETRYLRDYPKLVHEGDAARITAYTVEAEERTLADAKRLFDELMAYAIDNNRIRGDMGGAGYQPAAPFKPSVQAHRTKVLFFLDDAQNGKKAGADSIRILTEVLEAEDIRGKRIRSDCEDYRPRARDAAWLANQLCLPACEVFDFRAFLPSRPMINLAETLDELAAREVVVLRMHALPVDGSTAIAVYGDRLRTFVRTLKSDSRFEVMDCDRLAAGFKPRCVITKAEIGSLRRTLVERLGPIDSSWCVADVFQAVVKFLRGEAAHTPGIVCGFSDLPRGVTAPVRVTADDLRKAAAGINLERTVPCEIAVGGIKIGPADFLYAALEVLDAGASEVLVSPRDQLGPVDQLFERHDGRLCRQLWTLRYEPTFESRSQQTPWKGWEL